MEGSNFKLFMQMPLDLDFEAFKWMSMIIYQYYYIMVVLKTAFNIVSYSIVLNTHVATFMLLLFRFLLLLIKFSVSPANLLFNWIPLIT